MEPNLSWCNVRSKGKGFSRHASILSTAETGERRERCLEVRKCSFLSSQGLPEDSKKTRDGG